MSQRNQVPAPPPRKTVDISDPRVRQAVGAASDATAAAYFAAKMTPPATSFLLFTSTSGLVLNDDFKGSFNPMSIMVYNPTPLPIFVSTSGSNPAGTGIAIQPLSISPRLPIPGRSLVVGLTPGTDLSSTQYEIQIFRFATPD
jgi:hypothetical protein